jgi:8-amino-7-oxononanoate synthase
VMGSDDVDIYSDELNHASIVDGCRLARARTHVYPHGDIGYLQANMVTGTAIVVTDAVFSMDGDVAPLNEISNLCAERDSLLVTDEAHDVFGLTTSHGRNEHLRVGTLSKFLGSSGGFVAGPASLIDLLRNRARSFIYTTAAPPAEAAAALAALAIFRSAEGDDLRERLRSLIDMISPGHVSPIIPFVFGDESSAVEASLELLGAGLHVPAIRPPSVPAGSSRLRVTVSAAHTEDQVDRLLAALDRCRALLHA